MSFYHIFCYFLKSLALRPSGLMLLFIAAVFVLTFISAFFLSFAKFIKEGRPGCRCSLRFCYSIRSFRNSRNRCFYFVPKERRKEGRWGCVCKVTTQDTENFDEELQPLASARISFISSLFVLLLLHKEWKYLNKKARVLRVLPSGRTVPHIQGFFNFTETRLATAGKSWHPSCRTELTRQGILLP